MIPRIRRRVPPVAAVGAMIGAAVGAGVATPEPAFPRSGPRQRTLLANSAETRLAPQHEAFGFRLGEQRRYALGPEDLLGPGEFEVWTLRLDEVGSDAGMPLYTFAYSYEYARRNAQDLEQYLGQATVVVNQYGFPLEIEYGANRLNGITTGGTGHNGRVVWVGDEFFAEAPEHRGGWRFSFDLPKHDALDTTIPSGLFISEGDNPALITLPAAIFQATGATEMEFLVLRPDRIGARRGRDSGRRRAPPGGAGRGGFRRGRSRNPGGRSDVVFGKLEFKAVEEIEIGGRTYEATRLESRETEGDVFIGNDGALLRLEMLRGFSRAHVRLLHPSEY